jgi:hypothetical protein
MVHPSWKFGQHVRLNVLISRPAKVFHMIRSEDQMKTFHTTVNFVHTDRFAKPW